MLVESTAEQHGGSGLIWADANHGFRSVIAAFAPIVVIIIIERKLRLRGAIIVITSQRPKLGQRRPVAPELVD